MTPETKTKLKAARTLLSDPEHWVKGALAKDANDWDTDPKGASAVCFCSVGALIAVDADWDTLTHNAYENAVETLIGQLPTGHRWLSEYNDDPTTTHADILALFDRAIGGLT